MNNNKIKFGIAAAIIVAVIATSVPLFAGSQAANSDAASSSQAAAPQQQQQESKVVRIGYFPNINHAQAVIGLGRGDFQKALGSNVEVKTQVFNAGPSAIEALFAKQVDITYIGPNPAINGYVKSDGQGLRIVSGAASGGAVFVVRNDSGIQTPADFAGKKFASPQLGNTQDVALRKYLLENGYRTKENGGNVEVIPAANADILALFLKKEIDGAWVPEPWGAKLVKEAGGRIFLDEQDRWPGGQFVTAHIIVSTDYLKNNPDVVKKVIAANVDETKWINDHPDEALKVYNEELKKLTGKTIPEDEYKAGTSRLTLTYDPVEDSLFKSASDAHDIGFLKQKPDLSGIYDLTLLNEVLKEKGLPQIS
ncbi:ABC transporter, substrate-binding protein, aliphatic sulfonates family [Candidatus Nitrososphaera evergladensis SR1]|jgi:NitT/TauT family transport system substrate-binding protein|uniref:ABC transporter, substrate-binding protein, aliphatic sulfonates family n=2 Tax=Nitrososphaera TaxID=497726 RepID=A0A075MU23_9ARCH|nr:ABC transporter, substrate-binding protein, aliphatic sulfonates family [Candidatus Nitrososphaera evergladensis SR1]